MDGTNFVRKSIPALEMGVYVIQYDQDHHRHDKILEMDISNRLPSSAI